jgi:DNA-binding response OmpR family regulator
VGARLRSGRPGLKVLFMSGHAEHAALREALEAGARFLQKPFTPQALAAAVRAALDA